MSDIRLGMGGSERENKALLFTYLALGPLLTENLRLEEVMISFMFEFLI